MKFKYVDNGVAKEFSLQRRSLQYLAYAEDAKLHLTFYAALNMKVWLGADKPLSSYICDRLMDLDLVELEFAQNDEFGNYVLTTVGKVVYRTYCETEAQVFDVVWMTRRGNTPVHVQIADQTLCGIQLVLGKTYRAGKLSKPTCTSCTKLLTARVVDLGVISS